MLRLSCLIMLACSTFIVTMRRSLSAAEPQLVQQSFDHDPVWEGFRNRLLPEQLPLARQKFGYRSTNHAGGEKAGEIGGIIQRAARRAYYAARISPKSLQGKVSASGRFAVRRADGSSGMMIGWFNERNSHGWRTPDSLAFRIDGNDGKYWLFYEYGTTNRATGGGGAFEGQRYQTTATLPFLADGTVHSWSLRYDPDGAQGLGMVEFQVDERTYSLPLQPGHKQLGALFDRFGIWNQQTPGGSMEVYFDNLIVDGRRETFDVDPKWTAAANNDSYEQRIIRPFHDFGYSRTNFAGGDLGEIGGIIFRDERPAYFADRVRPLSLDSELRASGTLTLRTAGADSGVMLGWFNGAKKKSKATPEHDQPQTDYLGIYLEGPSRVGHYFRAAYSTSTGNHHAPTGEGTAQERPVVLPAQTVHRWSLHYDPLAAGRRGEITVSFDDQTHHLELDENARQQGASFDRFGLFNVQSGGHHVEVFIDDVSYSK
jgi:hypothetical protein